MRRALSPYVIVIAGILSLGGPAFAEDAFTIIVHKDNPATELTTKELRRMFQGKRHTWPGGQEIEPIDLGSEYPARASFSERVFHKDADAVERAYLKRVLSGKGQPPRQVSTAADVISYVSSHPNAIGYVDPSHVNASVKVIAITCIIAEEHKQQLPLHSPSSPHPMRVAEVANSFLDLVREQ